MRVGHLGELGVRHFPALAYATQIEALVRLDLGDDWLRGVLWHNGVRLLGEDGTVASRT